MPLDIRYVAFCPRRGVYLGVKDKKVVWSKDEGVTERDEAPTFSNKKEFFASLLVDGIPALGAPFSEDCEEIQLREVVPSGKDNHATVNDCGNTLMPRWGKNEVPVK